MFSFIRFVLWVLLIYVYFQAAEWAWTSYLPNLSGGNVLLISLVVMVFCVTFAQFTVWKISELFIREKYFE